jgi:hypothetical protein
MRPMEEATARTRILEPLWHVQLGVIFALLLQLLLPNELVAGPKYVLAFLEAILLVLLLFTTPRKPIFKSVLRRVNAITLLALTSAANIYSVGRLASQLLHGGVITNGSSLLLASINIYLTNIIVFGLWYWEIDGGGHGIRQSKQLHERDFMFPQQATPRLAPIAWEPTFIDYLYVSVTNASAFSPTDTMPLTHRSKLLMTVQALVSLVTIALVVSRAVNILH